MTDDKKQATPPLLKVSGLTKHFPIYSKGLFKKQVATVRAVDNVSFELKAGETLGLVGESGCGKTTAGRCILRALKPTSGKIDLNLDGETVDLAALKEREMKPYRTRMQMIFQDPFASLNPRMTVRDIVAESLVIHGLARGSDLDDRVAAMLKRVGLKPEDRKRYPHAFSGGQRQRIGIARALMLNPDLIVCDEAVSALDVSVQAQVVNLLQDLQEEMGLTYIFIAHDLSVVKHICDRIAVMYAGRLVELAKTQDLFDDPKHPYTRALLSSVPNPDPDVPMSTGLAGEVADASNLPDGCSFHPRCELAEKRCREDSVEIRELRDRSVACHLCSC